jgi:arsenical pump membrane protein
MSPDAITWTIVVLATAGVVIGPFGWPEASWPVLGAVLLVMRDRLATRLRAWPAAPMSTCSWLA